MSIIFFFFLIYCLYICLIGVCVCKDMSILDHGDKVVLKMFMPCRKLSILLSRKVVKSDNML